MKNDKDIVIQYFSAKNIYFWRWGDHGLVLEMYNGNTICYREDLIQILRDLSSNGLPPLGAVLLLLQACKTGEALFSSNGELFHDTILVLEKQGLLKEKTREKIEKAFQFLEYINKLPAELRSGESRKVLLFTIFHGGYHHVKKEEGGVVLDLFSSGAHDPEIFFGPRKLTNVGLNADLYPLCKAADLFPTTEALETAIRTGTGSLPAMANLEIPDENTKDLLEVLSEDAATEGVSRLTKKLIAAMNIPMFTRGSSDQAFGGVSEITNRGSFDRLLLTELAQDDETLMARLANNEALYFRREEPPAKIQEEKVILLDTTLRMWGKPRLFAISTALAFSAIHKSKAHVNSFALNGDGFTETDVTNKKGVIETMTLLDPGQDCMKGLWKATSAVPKQLKREFIFITTEENTESQAFVKTLPQLQFPFTWLATVNRNGKFQLFHMAENRKKLVSEAVLDLDDLLSAGNEKKHVSESHSFHSFPLFYPASKLKMTAENTYEVSKGLLTVSVDQRLLYWSSPLRGASELLSYVDHGKYCFGHDKENRLYFLVYSKEVFKMYLFENQKLIFNSSLERYASLSIKEVLFSVHSFYISCENSILQLDVLNDKTIKGNKEEQLIKWNEIKSQYRTPHLLRCKKTVNNGYGVINRIYSVNIDEEGYLLLDNRMLCLTETGTLHLQLRKHKKVKYHAHPEHDVQSKDGPSNIKQSCFTFSNGTQVLVDSRGVVSLQSTNPKLVPVTILMVVERTTAACAGNAWHGEPYFIDKKEYTSGRVFYDTYIQPFLIMPN